MARLVQRYKSEYKAQKRRKVIWKAGAISGGAVILIAGFVYLLFFSKFVDVRSVSINGAETIEQTDLNSAVSDWFSVKFLTVARRNNLLVLSSKKLVAYLSGKFPKLESVEVSKKLPHSIIVNIVERKPIGVWCLALVGKCFYFDKNLVAYAPTSGSAGFLLANIGDERNRDIVLGGEVAGDIWVKNLLLARDLLMKNAVNVQALTIPAGSFDEFNAVTSEGWKIMFSNQTDIARQISSLRIFLKDKIRPEQRAKLQYIDLRIDDRIYFK
jgi:hypothetical protein